VQGAEQSFMRSPIKGVAILTKKKEQNQATIPLPRHSLSWVAGG